MTHFKTNILIIVVPFVKSDRYLDDIVCLKMEFAIIECVLYRPNNAVIVPN